MALVVVAAGCTADVGRGGIGGAPDAGGAGSRPDASFDAGELDAGATPVPIADEFGCLDDASSDHVVADALSAAPSINLWFGYRSFIPIPHASGLDLRATTIVTPTPETDDPAKSYRRWYPLEVRGGLTGVCIAGGDFEGQLALDIGWHDSKENNSAAVLWFGPDISLSGARIFNNHDGIRPATGDGTTSERFVVAHTWVAYNRDDCIENDVGRGSGLVYDSLFDGCYVGVSTRIGGTADRTAQTITMDRVLLRMEPMPFPYRWWERNLGTHIYVPALENPDGYENHGYTTTNIPFGHGAVFKHNGGTDTDPRFAITNSVFLFQQIPHAAWVDFPPEAILTECAGNTVVWAGREPLDEFLAVFDAPAGCVEVTDDVSVWEDAVADWHARHPNVGAAHKPAIAGDLRIPRWDPQPW